MEVPKLLLLIITIITLDSGIGWLNKILVT